MQEVDTEFMWHPGFSIAQKRKSIRALHDSASEKGISPVLEISTKSENPIGYKLSAFNLRVIVNRTHEMSVESAYQGSKVFEQGGPYTDLYDVPSREAKGDPRLRGSGDLINFNLKGDIWELNPETAFYDWIYVNALHQHSNVKSEIIDFNGFTDIEFNPKKSINCQARAAALFVALARKGIVKEALSSPDVFKSIAYGGR